MKKKLSPFEQWMVKSNLEHAKTQGLKSVVNQLRANGYPQIAAAVEEHARNSAEKIPVELQISPI